MISIFIMYSTDRQKPLEYTISCLQDMELYQSCQKTLVVDGKIDVVPREFEVVQVPRIGGQFSWANMWNAGVLSAQNPIVVYLDADRLLPPSFLESVCGITDGYFAFTSKHFHMLEDMELDSCKRFLEANQEVGIFIDDEFLGQLKYEPRFQDPVHGPGKNVMSGSVAFTRNTYVELGGVDPWYRGHGAFADTDFHYQAAQAGCSFIDLDVPEIHYHHNKLDNDEKEIDEITLRRMGLDNFIYYCKKWKLPMVLAENLALRCGILRPTKYVEEQLAVLSEQ